MILYTLLNLYLGFLLYKYSQTWVRTALNQQNCSTDWSGGPRGPDQTFFFRGFKILSKILNLSLVLTEPRFVISYWSWFGSIQEIVQQGSTYQIRLIPDGNQETGTLHSTFLENPMYFGIETGSLASVNPLSLSRTVRRDCLIGTNGN